MARKSGMQIWIEYAVVRSILGVLRLMPLRMSMSAGAAFGGLAGRFVPGLRAIGLFNLSLAFPELSIRERAATLRSVFGNLGRVMATVSKLDKLSESRLRDLIAYEPEPEFAAAYQRTKDEGRGRIILGGHVGNWELQAFSFPLFFEPLTFLARRMDNPRIESLILGIRTRLGNRQLDKTNAAAGMMRILRSGGNIGVLADVNSHPKEGVFVRFFGVEACTASGVAMLALRTNAAIVPMWAIWDGHRRRYFIYHDAIIDAVDTGDRKADIRRITAEYTAALERVIRKFPDQWIWIHRRWKTRPPGEPEIY